MSKMNKGLKAVLAGIASFAIVLFGRYLIAKAQGQEATFEWIFSIVIGVLCGVSTLFGPDAEQRKKNRQKLAERLKGK